MTERSRPICTSRTPTRMQRYVHHEVSCLFGHRADSRAQYAESVTGARKRRAQKSKKKGGKAGGSKPTDSDFDSGDKCIIHYKKLGYKDDAVASKLGEEGHTKLSAKTISSRWLRLKKIVEEKEEERLDDELSDWHIGEVRLPAAPRLKTQTLTGFRMRSCASASMPRKPSTNST